MAQAKWLVHVDWNDDGDFPDANEDVTSDVLGLTLDHFRDLSSGHVEAARLELELRNDDHKYSPPNGGSPLSGNLKPGRTVWVRAAYPYDGFTDVAGTQLAAHTPDYDSGFSWTENIRNFDIAAGGTGAQTDSTQGNGDCVATVDFGDSDVSFGCNFSRGSDTADHGGLCLRYSNTTNYLYVRVTGTAVELRKVDAGADSQVASAAHTWGTSTEKFLQVVLHGDSIRVFVDDAEVLDASTSFNNTATKHGLFCDDEADHIWKDFGGWASLFFGAVDSIHPRPRRGAQYCYLRALDEMARLTGVTLYTYATALTFDDPVLVLGEDVTSKSTYGRRIRSIEARWTREAHVAQATVDNRLARRKDPKTVLNIVMLNGSKANLMTMMHRERGMDDGDRGAASSRGVDNGTRPYTVPGRRNTISRFCYSDGERGYGPSAIKFAGGDGGGSGVRNLHAVMTVRLPQPTR